MSKFTLKIYQQTSLAILRQYLEAARVQGAGSAFTQVSGKPYQPLPILPETPYVCLRVPTGGGKTLLAAHSAVIAAETYLGREYPLILWLVPTNTIRQQTLETLQKPGHPNREALLDAFNGRVNVLDIADFTQIRPQDLREKACVFVGTFATLRVKDTDGRKVYAHNEYMEPHFVGIPESTPDMERIEAGPGAGTIKYSFRNLLTLQRPLVIIDESQNAATGLMREVFERIQPECVFEFTATPTSNSNILHNVSASELKDEEMIKLPVVLTEHQNWEEAIQDALFTRSKLADLAAGEREFIRPILLIQAEEKGRTVTVDVVEKYLTGECRVPREHIAIATGAQRELDNVNLLDPGNKIEIVITIEALKEGWDCPFAYVFCSVATVHSKRDVEQLLGRVLRMPYARRRVHEELNKAYAHVSSSSWPQAVKLMEDRLVSMGFDRLEAAEFVQPGLPSLGGDTSAPATAALVLTLTRAPDLSAFDLAERTGLSILGDEDRVFLRYTGDLTPALEAKLLQSVSTNDRLQVSEALAAYHARPVRPLSPAERGEPFTVPQLSLLLDGRPERADYALDEARLWNPLDYPTRLTAEEFSIEEKATTYEIDLSGERLVSHYMGRQLPLDFSDTESGMTDLQLVRWLEPRLRQPNLRAEVLMEFIRQVVAHLTGERKLPLIQLIRARFALLKALAHKIKDYETQANAKSYQALLFGSEVATQTSYDYAFKFDSYPVNTFYQGRYQFPKHYFGNRIAEMNNEEIECAKAIDQNDAVKYWVRNLTHPSASFRLPLADGYFYPDFVVLLNDGRIAVIEYKGAHLLGSEGAKTDEKQNIGQLWAEKSGGQALFLMAVEQDERGRGIYKQIDDLLK